MSKIALEGNASGTGTFTIASPNSNSNYTLTLPSSTGTVVVTGGAQTIEFAAGTAAAPSITFTGDTNTGIFSPGADTIAFSEGGVESMRIDSSGNVGIGTSSPSGKLNISDGTSCQVNINSAAAGATRQILFSTSTNTQEALISANNATGELKFESGRSGTSAYFQTFYTNNAERMRIDSSGRVLVNKTSWSADAKLVVGPDTGGSIARLAISSNTTGDNPVLELFEGTTRRVYLNYDASGNICNLATEESGSALAFQTVSVERARITSDGEVCINTTGIGSTKLRVYQNGNSNDNSYSGIDIIKGSNNTTTAQVFQRFFTDAGNVGNGSITANGVSAATFTAYSDRRLKENIQDLPPQLDNICRLKPSEFDYIGYPEGHGHQIGFIAQDMQEVYPDVVAADGEGMLQIAGWSKTEARLVKAIQELKAITDAQATRIEALEAEVAALKGQ